MDPLNDLDRELMTALRVEPSAGFAPRVRARIASEPAAARWRVPRLALVTGGLALSALAVNLMFVPPRSSGSDRAVLPHQSLAFIAPLPAAAPSISPRIESRSEARVLSDVQVSRSEMLALQRLFSGEIVAPPAGDVPVEVVIPPIALDAITLPAIPEGERQ